MSLAAELDADLEMGLRIDVDSLSARQHALLKIIRSEKIKLQNEAQDSDEKEFWRRVETNKGPRRE